MSNQPKLKIHFLLHRGKRNAVSMQRRLRPGVGGRTMSDN